MSGFGKQSVGGTFLASGLFIFIGGKRIFFSDPGFLLHSNVIAPYVILGDEAYTLLPYLMKPTERSDSDSRSRNLNLPALYAYPYAVQCYIKLL